MVSFLIDAALAVMLVTATAYLVIVNKRLKLLRTGQSEINALVSTFSKSIDDTDASMKRMVASATEIAARLSDELDRAKGMKEDMALILGSCERTTARMEESVQHARALLRRLDEGAMRATRNRARPEAADAAGSVAKPLDAEPAPSSPLLSALKAAEADKGEFQALETALRAVAGQKVEGQPAEAAAPVSGGPAKAAASAFYARLRTVGSEVSA
jgi:ABC-type transporter Mla subunit MlaD